MTPESLSREGSPGPEGIHLHPAPQNHQVSVAAVANNGNGGVIMSNDNPAQVVASHLEVKTNNFPPGVSHPVLTGAQSKCFYELRGFFMHIFNILDFFLPQKDFLDYRPMF